VNDHGLPLAMYPRREICVTLEVATGVGGGIGTKEDGRGNRTTSQIERVVVWARRVGGRTSRDGKRSQRLEQKLTGGCRALMVER
jgi:hypothetical protein